MNKTFQKDRPILFSLMFFLSILISQNLSAQNETEETYVIVEEMPIFPACKNTSGGKQMVRQCSDQKIYEFFINETIYPNGVPLYQENVIVYVRYVIDTLGYVSNIEIIRSAKEEAFNLEAKRVVSILPRMIPGMQRGRPVRVQYTVPIKFDAGRIGNNSKSRKGSSLMFKNGEENFYKYIAMNLKYPENAKDNCVSGTVYLSYLIDSLGNVDSMEVLYPINSDLEQEAKRVVASTSGMWSYNRAEPRNYDLKHTVPVFFDIKGGGCENRDDYYNKGTEFFDKKKYQQAASAFRNSIQKDALYGDALFNCAMSYIQLKKDDSACYYLSRIKHRADANKFINLLCK